MACPEASCNTKVYKRYESLVMHWRIVHEPEILIHGCQLCNRSFTRRADGMRHLRSCHSSGLLTKTYTNRHYIPPGGHMPLRRQRDVDDSSQVLAPLSQEQEVTLRYLARRERIRIREEAESGPSVQFVNRERDNNCPYQLFYYSSF